MRRKMALMAMVSIVVVGVPASPAAGGGWWSYITARPSLVAPGMTVRIAENGVLLSTAEVAIARSGEPLYAYLIEDFDRRTLSEAMSKAEPGDWWRLSDATATKLAPAQVRLGEGGFGRVRAEFRMPRTPSGRYSFMICDDGCVHPLGDSIPTTLTVVQSPTIARLKDRSDRMRERLFRAETATRRLRTHSQGTLDEVDSMRGDISTLRGEVSHLEGKLRRAETGSTTLWAPLMWASFGGMFVALVVIFTRRRSRARPTDRRSAPLTVEDFLAEAAIGPGELERTPPR